MSRLLDSKGIAVAPKAPESENFVSGPQASLLCVSKASWNFPGGLLVKNRPGGRCLGMTIQGTWVPPLALEHPICHEQLSLDTTATQPGPCPKNPCSAMRGRRCNEQPPTAERESQSTAAMTQHSPSKQIFFKKIFKENFLREF